MWNEGIFFGLSVAWFFFIALFVGGRVHRDFVKRVEGRDYTEGYWSIESEDPVVQKEGKRYINKNLLVVLFALGPPTLVGIIATALGLLPW